MVTLPNGITMSQIGPSRWTRPERVVRMFLVREGLKHRCHWPIPGTRRTADFVMGRVCLFVDGRFWHDPASAKGMSRYWREKVARNAERDLETNQRVVELGMVPLRI